MIDNSTNQDQPSRRNHPDKRMRRCPAVSTASKQTGRDNNQVKACKDKAAKKPLAKTAKQAQIVALKKNNPVLTQQQIANEVNINQSYVSSVLQRYGLNKQSIDDFVSNKSDIFNGIQDRLLSSLTDTDYQKGSMYQKICASGILQDKIRDLSGESKVQPMVIINRISVGGRVEDRPIDVTPEDEPVIGPKVEATPTSTC